MSVEPSVALCLRPACVEEASTLCANDKDGEAMEMGVVAVVSVSRARLPSIDRWVSEPGRVSRVWKVPVSTD